MEATTNSSTNISFAVYTSLITAASSVNTARPAPPPRSSTLARGYNKLIKRYFPALHTNRSAAQQTNISIRIGKLASAQNARFEAQQAEKEDKASKSVTKWLGENRMNLLLNMTGCLNEDDLNTRVLIYSVLANAEKSARLSLFQAAINTLLDERDIEGFLVMITMARFNNMLPMKWDATSVDSTMSGWLGNPNVFGPLDEEATSALNV